MAVRRCVMRTIAALAGVCVAVGADCAIQIEKPTQPETPRVPSGGLDTPWLKEERVQLGITNVLDDFHEAAAKADFEKYFRHWTEASVFLGTDATERWVGNEFKEFARPHFEKGKGWKYVPRDRKVTMAPDGEHAFFDELLDNEKLGVCRGSGVMRQEKGEWFIMQYNLSIPVPNDLAERVVGLIKAGPPKTPEGERKHIE